MINKSSIKRQALLSILLLTGLAGTSVWCYGEMRSAHTASELTRANLHDSQKLARQIQALKQTPSLAGSEEMQFEELARLLEISAGASDLSMDQVIRIRPLQPQRVGDTVYKERATTVQIADVTMQQLMTFLHHLTSNNMGLQVKSIRVVAPRDDETGKKWATEVSLTYLIYSPRSGIHNRD